MKQFILYCLITLSLFSVSLKAQDLHDFDLPPEFAALFENGEIDPIKFQELYDKSSPETQAEVRKKLEAYEAYVNETMPLYENTKLTVIDQIGQISFLLQDLGQQVEVNKKLNILNKQEIEAQIVNLQTEVEQLKGMALSTGLLDNPEILFRAILIIDELLRCVDGAVASKLTSIPAISTDSITTRSISSSDLEPKLLQEHVTRNAKRLEAIHKQTNDMGASWFNKAFKKCSNLVSLKTAKLSLVAAAIATYYMYRFSNDSFGAYPLDDKGNLIIPKDENLFQKFCRYTGVSWFKRNIPGEQTFLLPNGNTSELKANNKFIYPVANADNITLFGKTVEKLEELHIFNSVTQPLFTLGGMCFLFQEKVTEIQKNAYNTWQRTVAYLQGKDEFKAVDEYAREPRFVLADVEGHEHIKQEMSILPAYFADPEKMDRTGKSPGRFWMLHGNSRTGKSMLGEAVAGEIKATLKAKGSTQKFTYMPITAEMLMLYGIETIINYANTIKPCIICIDEFDLSGAQRERNSKLLAEILNAMGNAQLNDEVGNQVFFIFICNHIEHNDFALINRMDHIIEVSLPTLADRKNFLIKELNKQFILASEEFIDKIAQESEGKTIEELKRTITLAKQESFKAHQPVTEETLQQAFNQQIHRMIYTHLPTQLPCSKEEVTHFAAYQAGQALTISYGNNKLNIAQATILGIRKKFHEGSIFSNATLSERKQKPKDWTKYGKVFTYHSQDALALETHKELLDAIKLKLAGHIAEEIVCGTQSANYRTNAKNKAYILANKVVFAGVTEMALPKTVINELKLEEHNLVKRCEAEVRALLTEHKDKLTELTEMLIKKQIVTGSEIKELVAGKASATNTVIPVEPLAA
ncbi:MAG: AAA family ATPase [Candidatus Babeliales bacterium]